MLKKISPEYSLEELMLKLKLQYFPMSLENTLMLGKTEDKRRRGQQRIRLLDSITDSMDKTSKFQEIVEDRRIWHATVYGISESDMT